MIDDTVRFSNHSRIRFNVSRLRGAVAFAMRNLSVSGPVSLAVVEEETMIGLNRRFKGRDEPTDVLAFPYEDAAAPDPEPELGEIVVSAETAASQAKEIGVPFETELALLALHGLLHLCGMRDSRPNERDAMLSKARGLLEAFERSAPTLG